MRAPQEINQRDSPTTPMSAKPARASHGVLATNMLIHWEHLDPDSLPLHSSITAITLAELAAGVASAADPVTAAERVDLLRRAESSFEPLPFDGLAARGYGRITAAVRAAGRSPHCRVADQLIAAIALANELALYTTNADDFVGLDNLINVIAVERPSYD